LLAAEVVLKLVQAGFSKSAGLELHKNKSIGIRSLGIA